MKVDELYERLQAQIETSSPERLATLLFQLANMKSEFDKSESHKKTYRLIFARISARLACKTMELAI